MRLYAFLDLDHVPTAWAVMRGMLVSARMNLDYSPGCISFMLAGLILSENNSRLCNELVFEDRRRTNHSARTSRLGGMYFFDERSLALRTSEGWGPHFKEENLFALAVTPRGKVDRFDSDWITHADYDASGRLELGSYDRIDQYWRGIPASDQPAWELLCDGLAIVLDDDARKRAYEVVKREFPDCLLAIEISRLACETSGSSRDDNAMAFEYGRQHHRSCVLVSGRGTA